MHFKASVWYVTMERKTSHLDLYTIWKLYK